MAKTLTDEDIKLNIIINGNAAQKQLGDLEKSTRKLNEENNQLILQKKKLERLNQQESEEYKTLTATIKANTTAIDNNKATMRELQNQIGITGLTMKQLSEKAKLLRLQLNNVIPGGEAHQKYKAELAQVTARIGELSGKAQQSKFSLSSMADGFNKYQGLALSFMATLTGVVFSIQKIIDINGKLSDAQADVMKTTGMNKKEVDELTKSFGALETRTSRMDLLSIAEQGGRIGILKEDIGDFVNVMNKASVSLGDSFTGGAEEVANKLGKIKFLFQETKDLDVDKAYNAIGSAINDLGANGVASEANIAEFTTRIGSLTDVLKPTIQETLALGTAFEESGIEAEVSARAYNIFMKQASTESAKFAKVMGISQQAVENMINTNPLDFMMKFAEGMRGMDATKTAKTLDYLGVNADGANKVIGAMGNNIQRFRDLIELSNDSFADGTSLVDEYNIKNENLAATLEKISKRVSGFFSSEGFVSWLGGAVTWISKFIGASEDADGSVAKWRNTIVFAIKVFTIMTAAMITNVTWQKLVALWTNRNTEAQLLYNVAAKARAFADGVGIVLSQAYAATTMLLTGNVKGAAQAFRILTATMNSTPWGFILSAVVAIAVAYKAFSQEIDKVAKQQQLVADVHAEAAASIFKEKTEMEALVKVATNEFESKENRLAAIKRLNEISPEYLGNLTLENIKTAQGKKLLDSYIESLQRMAYTKSLNNKLQKLEDEKTDIKTKSDSDVATFTDQFNAVGDQITSFLPGVYGGRGKDSLKRRAKIRRDQLLKDKQEEQDMIQKMIDEDIKKNPKNYVDPVVDPSKFNVPDPEADKNNKKKNPNSTAEEIAKLKFDNEQRYLDATLSMRRRMEDEAIALMQEGYQKEMALENLRYIRAMQDLENQKVSKSELIKINAEIAKAEEAGDKTKVAALTQIKEGWKQKNAQLNEQINQLELNQVAIHNTKVATISEKSAQERLQKEKEQFDREKNIRETKFNDEYAALGNNEVAKAKLKKQYEKNELEEQEKFLKNLIEEFKSIIAKGNFEGIDLSLLTPEQVEDFKKKAEEVALALSKLNGEKDKLTGKKTSGENFQALGLQATTDVFGFSPENWDTLFNNLNNGTAGIQEMAFAVQALTNMWAMYGQFVTANENAQLQKFERNSDRKKNRLKRFLDAGFISQVQYNKGVEGIDNELAKKKADLEYKQAKRQRLLAAAQIIQSTAQAIIGIWAQFPKFDFGATAGIMSGVVGALGALQLATVLKTPLPAKGYEDGLYGDYVKREQDGKIFKSTGTSPMRSGLFSKPRILVGEGPGDMPEMVIDKQAYAQLSPGTRNALLREIRGIKGFEDGKYNADTQRIEVPAGSQMAKDASSDAELIKMMLGVIAENTAVMKDLRDKGVIGKFYKNDWDSMRNIKESIDAIEKTREKSKR